jgi:hypothetical protein
MLVRNDHETGSAASISKAGGNVAYGEQNTLTGPDAPSIHCVLSQFREQIMTVVVCMKAGPKYPSDYANRLCRAVRRHGHEGRFYCLTDGPAGLERDIITLPVSPLCEGWWHKIYLFSWDHGIAARLLYMDIDMVVTGSLEDFLRYDGDFATGSRFNRPAQINSTVMSIPPGYGRQVWNTFVGYRSMVMRSFGGDSRFLESIIGSRTRRSQEMFPGQLVSYKKHVRGGSLPEGARLVSFHGKPDPEDVDEDFVKRFWV